ncbi:MAG: acyl-CoA dehydrogenase family protein [Alphaproteobacteria bacterium]
MADQSFLDWPFLDDRHRRLAEKLEAWTAAEIAPEGDDEDDVDGHCRRLVAKLGAAGWLDHCVAAADGGAGDGLDVRAICLCREILARNSGLADFAFAMQGLGTGPIALFGSDQVKRAYLPAVARGERIAAFALSEPEAGSDVAAIATRAEADGDGYVLNGTKTWISNAGIADHYVVFARTSDEGARGLSAFVVDADSPGLEVSERIKLIAPHPIGSLSFTDCPVPRERLLGTPGQGFKVAMATLDIFRASVGAAALGFARRALDEALARAQSRRAFGQPIAEFQLIQQKLADMATEIDASALLVYRSAWTRDTQAARVTRESSMAKMYATEAAQRVVDQAVQIFGGLGVVAGVPVERLYREVRALRIYEGTTEINKLVIARQVLSAHGETRAEPKAAAEG